MNRRVPNRKSKRVRMDQEDAERRAHLAKLALCQLVQNGHNTEMDDAARIAELEKLNVTLAQLVRDNILSEIAWWKPDSCRGKVDPIELEKWMREFEKILAVAKCPANLQVEAAAFYFQGEADYWWEANKDVFLARENFDWEALKVALRAQFYPPHFKYQKGEELLALKQDGMSVGEYYKKFNEISRFAEDLVPNEAMKVRRFVAGLNSSIRWYIAAAGDFATVHELYEKAGMIELIDERERMEAKERKVDGAGESSRGRFRPNNFRGNCSQAGGSFRNRGNQNRGPEGHDHSSRYQPDHPGVDCQGMGVESHNRGKYCILEFDGASKRNPGPSGAGVVLRAESIGMVFRLRQGVGIATSTVAEYRALILGLDYALKEGFTHIQAQGDSNLVCMQVQGLWRIKNQNIANLCDKAKELMDQFLSFEICHVEREFNSEADALANQAVYLQNEEVQVDSELMENGC